MLYCKNYQAILIRTKTNNRLFFNKRKINNGNLINKSNTSNILPLLINYYNNNKNIDINNIKKENEKLTK